MAKYMDINEMGQAQAEFHRKYEEYLQTLVMQNRQWRNCYGEIIDTIINDLSSEEKKKLYGISTPADISDMGRSEQELLVAILWEIATHQAEPKDNSSKMLQKEFLRRVQMHLGILEIQSDSATLLNGIKNIDSKSDEISILQTIMEYLFLENNDHSYIQKYNNIIRCFDYASKDFTLIHSIQERIDRYVSAAGVVGLATKYSDNFNNTQEVELIPATYGIEIMYDKVDFDAVKILKASLENKKNTCFLQEIIKGKNTQKLDKGFVIVFGDNAEAQETLSFGKQETIFNAYGCKIISPVGSDKYVLTYDPQLSNYNRDEFLEFYQSTCLATDQIQKSTAKTLAEDRKKQKPKKSRFWENILEVPEKVLDNFDVKEDDGWRTMALKTLGTIAAIPYGIVAFATALVVILPEELVHETINNIKNSNFDRKFVKHAQRDILIVKMSEIIWNRQNKNAKPKV